MPGSFYQDANPTIASIQSLVNQAAASVTAAAASASAAATSAADAAAAVSGYALKANNLSDLPSATTARLNLGLDQVNNTTDTNKPVSTATAAAIALVPTLVPGGRLTLQTHTPVMTTSQTAKAILYYDNYAGNKVPYFDGTSDLLDTITANEISTSMAASGSGVLNADGVFDVWWWHNAGTPVIVIATNGAGGGWASDTAGSNVARGTGYSQLDYYTRGYITNKNALANAYNGATQYGTIPANRATYLGTIMTDAAAAGLVSHTFGSAASGGGAARFGVWNYYHRVKSTSDVIDNGVPYTYVTATIRASRASNTNRATFVIGVAEDPIIVSHFAQITTVAAAGANGTFGLGLDSTTAVYKGIKMLGQTSSAAVNIADTVVPIILPQLGQHYIQALEAGDGANANTFDTSQVNIVQATIIN